MTERIYNFSAGPAVLPEPVLERAREEMASLGGSGLGVMESSHRSKLFAGVLDRAESGIRRLLAIPANYRILFLQGGATLQFSMVPMNLLPADAFAEYVITGSWGVKACREAAHYGNVDVAFSSEAAGDRSVPDTDELKFDPNASYVHYTSNETIDGVEFKYDLDAGGVPVVCDASSNILSKPIDVERYALIYAGAQKNIGPSGVTVVIIRDDMIKDAPREIPPLLTYKAIADNGSL